MVIFCKSSLSPSVNRQVEHGRGAGVLWKSTGGIGERILASPMITWPRRPQHLGRRYPQSSGVTVDPQAALTALLDVLEPELLAAPPVEVRFSLRLTGRAGDAACDEVRSLLNEAKAATEEGFDRARPYDMRNEPVRFDLGLYRH
jgi:hypothetical protein